MKEVIAPIHKDIIKSELTEERFLRNTNKAGNEIYVVTHQNSPQTMLEIGRLREITFRHAGGGTGKEVDIDHYDTCDNPYKQLIVWDPENEVILGGYRFIHCGDKLEQGGCEMELATSRLFQFSDQFKKEYLPHVIELGRSFVQPDYQSSKAGAKGLFALDNLWDGLGALMVDHPEIIYFFGKVTMYSSYNTEARNIILHFFDRFFKDEDKLVYPFNPMEPNIDLDQMEKLFGGLDYKDAYKVLSSEVRNRGENIPPLINAYMGLSPTMRTFGTVINDHFGEVEETGIILNIDEMYDKKVGRHVSSYLEEIAESDLTTKLRFQ